MTVATKTRNSASDLLTRPPVGTTNNSAEQNAKGGYEAQAFALVQTCIAIARDHGNEWLRVVARLCDMETGGRKAFRAGLDAHKKEMQAHVIAHPEGSKERVVFGGAKSSAIVRFSQLKTISRAMDTGWLPELVLEDGKVKRRPQDNSVVLVDPYHAIYGQAVAVLRSQGAGSNAGATVKTFAEKLKAWIEKNCTAPETELPEAAAVIKAVAKAFKHPADPAPL